MSIAKEKDDDIPTKNFNQVYKQITEVGSGTYGKVYKVAHLGNDNKLLAFKKITYSKDTEGFPQTALREIRILQSLDHQNIIKLHAIITSKPSQNNKYRSSTFLVFDYMDHDLYGLIKVQHKFTPAQIKCIMKQLIEGVYYMHQKDIIHRDLKSANILLNNKGEVKIADFGLARNLNSYSGNYTTCVVTLWYRAPELLLGAKRYTTLIDMWSVGCILAELWIGRPLFPGDKEMKQCELIFQICGSPDEFLWPESKNLPHYNTYSPNCFFPRNLRQQMKQYNPSIDEITLDFLDELLQLNPERRLKAGDALNHPYFNTEPFPTNELIGLPDQECHYTLLKMRERERQSQYFDNANNKGNNFQQRDNLNLNNKRKFNESFGDRRNQNIYPPQQPLPQSQYGIFNYNRPPPPLEGRPEQFISNNNNQKYSGNHYHSQQYANIRSNIVYNNNPPPPKYLPSHPPFGIQNIETNITQKIESEQSYSISMGLSSLISNSNKETNNDGNNQIQEDMFEQFGKPSTDEYEKLKKKIHI